MFIIGYRTLKKDIKEINEISVEIEGEYERSE
jgi:hypothetical protein